MARKIIRCCSNTLGSPPSFLWSAGGIGESASGAGAEADAGSGTGRTGEQHKLAHELAELGTPLLSWRNRNEQGGVV